MSIITSGNIQPRLDSLREGGLIGWGASTQVRIAAPLRRKRQIFIRGDGALLYYAAAGENWMGQMLLGAALGDAVEFTADLAEGAVPAIGANLPHGRYVVGYGQGTRDPNIKHYVGIGEGGLPPAPYAINGREHWYAPLISNCDGSVLQDLRFGQAAGLAVDYSLGVDLARNFVLRNLSGTFNTAVCLTNCESFVVHGLRAVVRYDPALPASGRAITFGMCRDGVIEDLEIDASDATAAVLFEAHCGRLRIRRMTIRLRHEPALRQWQQPIFMVQGDSRDIEIDDLRVECGESEGLYLFDHGGESDQMIPKIGRVSGKWKRLLWPQRCIARELVAD